MAANSFGEYLASAHAGITAEGDNRVLMIKVVKDLLGIYFKRPEYFYQGENIKLKDKRQLFCEKTLLTIFHMIERHRLLKLINKMQNLKTAGKSNFDILMFETSDEIQELAYSFGERLAWVNCISGLEKLSQSQKIVKNYFLIFAWEVILRELGLLLLEDWICPKLAKELKEHYNELIKVASQDVDVIVDSLNIPVHGLRIPIAKDYVGYNSYKN